MRSFVTGISGFGGRHLTERLLKLGHEVSGIGLEGPEEKPAYRFIPCDILDFERLREKVGSCEPDFVFHLAGLVRPSESLLRPLDYFRINVQGTVNLLESVRLESPRSRVLLVSTAEVYGFSTRSSPFQEDDPASPENPYACSKWLLERTGLQYRKNFDLQVLIVRPFNHSGPGQPAGFVLPDICLQIARLEREGRPGVLKLGNLEPVVDFSDVRDVVRAYTGLALRGEPGEVYNVGSGQGIALSKILELALQLARIPVQVEADPSRPEGPKQPGNRVADISRLSRAIGWQPRFQLRRTVRDTLQYWRDALKASAEPNRDPIPRP